jgi:hypothetical protein
MMTDVGKGELEEILTSSAPSKAEDFEITICFFNVSCKYLDL